MLFIENKLMERTVVAIFMLTFLSFWVTRNVKSDFSASSEKSSQAREPSVTPGVASQTLHPNFDAVSTLMRARVASGAPSIAIAIAHHGRIVWEEAIGVSDRERNIRATVNTPYYLASISKTITATGLQELVARHRVNLDRPVNDYLSTAKISSPMFDVSKATVRRVANHTAGLTTYDRDCWVGDRDCDPSPAEAIRRYGVIVWPPGGQFDYSNLDYGILGEVVAQVSHATLQASLQRNIFAPLGMRDCFLDASADRMNSAAGRYDSSAPFLRTSTRSTTPGASAIYCSVHDLVLFGMFHLKDHLASQKRILSDRLIEEMQAPSLAPGEKPQYGLSWWVQENLNGYRGVLAQGGTNDGTAYLQLIPSEDIAVAMLMNAGTPDGSKVIDQILSAILPQYKKNLEDGAVTQPSAPASPAVGPSPVMIGTWNGFVQTYRGRTPLRSTINPSGELIAKLGKEPEVRLPQARFSEGVVRWRMPGSLGVEGEPFDYLAMRLHLRGTMLAGAARTQPAPSNRKGSLVSYWVQLERK